MIIHVRFKNFGHFGFDFGFFNDFLSKKWEILFLFMLLILNLQLKKVIFGVSRQNLRGFLTFERLFSKFIFFLILHY